MKLASWFVVAIMALAAQPAWSQSLHNETTVQVPLKGPVNGGTDTFDSNSGEHFAGEAAAHSLAAYGVLKVSGVAESDFYWGDGVGIVQSYFESRAQSKASFIDLLTFGGQPTGTSGVLAFDVLLRGTHTATGAGPWGYAISTWQFDLRVNGQPFQAFRSETLAVNPNDGWTFTVVDSGDAFSLHHYEVPFVFGSPVTLDARLDAGAFAHVVVAGSDGGFDVGYDLSRSAYWAGITGVTVGGEAVDYSVSSASGTDYRNSLVPIPEPGSASLVGLGLFALFALRQLRQGHGRAPRRGSGWRSAEPLALGPISG